MKKKAIFFVFIFSFVGLVHIKNVVAQTVSTPKKYSEIVFKKDSRKIEDIMHEVDAPTESFIPTREGDIYKEEIYTAQITLQKKGKLYFVSRQGQYYCGTQGCSFEIYYDAGKGYKLALSATVFSAVALPAYISDDISSILLCGNNDPPMAEWRLNPKTLEYDYVGYYTKGVDPDSCSITTP